MSMMGTVRFRCERDVLANALQDISHVCVRIVLTVQGDTLTISSARTGTTFTSLVVGGELDGSFIVDLWELYDTILAYSNASLIEAIHDLGSVKITDRHGRSTATIPTQPPYPRTNP